MKKYILMVLAVLLIASMGLVTLSKEKPLPFVEMEVKGVRIDPVSQSPVVILADKDGKKALPIWVGLPEANAIDKELKQVSSQRPMTHDLLHSILKQTQVTVKEVKVVDLKEQTYYATLYLTLNKKLIEIDARPSDAIILALKSKVPILVSAKVLDQQGFTLSREEGMVERHGIRIQELTPSLSSHFNFKGQKGVLVSEVLSGSAPETSGIKAGDIITKINQKEVGSIQEFEETFDKVKTGSTIRIQIFRDEKFQEVNLTLKP
ncbi:MAG: PDZ domain-containing protein [Deltaproteobacteria bacterium]|nr:PDZ domain-containing protein [Deltaproteobacteria bacterium]